MRNEGGMMMCWGGTRKGGGRGGGINYLRYKARMVSMMKKFEGRDFSFRLL